MQFTKTLAALLTAASMAPFLVPAAGASESCTRKVVTNTSCRTYPATKVITKTRTIYKTSYVPRTRTVYRTSYVPITRTVYKTAYVNRPVVVSEPFDNTAVTTTRTFMPETASTVYSAPEPIISSDPDFYGPTVVYKEHHHKVRVSTLEPEYWY